jgi:hypothetical protein
MRLVIGALLFVALSFGNCDRTPHTTSGNFSADLKGPVDTRPSTWGTAEAVVKPVTFTVPVGCRVQIMKVRGDFIAWPLGRVPPGTQAGVLIAMSTTKHDPSLLATYSEDTTFLYYQHGTQGEIARIPFNDVLDEVYLGEDGVLEMKMSDWLNCTSLTIHCEVTWTLVFRYVEAQ